MTYVAELARRVGLASQDSLYDSLTEVLGWRPYEEDALARILSMIDEGSLQVLAATLGIPPQETMPESPLNRRVAKQVYKLRNAIAHHRIGLEESPGMDWSQLIRGLCSIVKELQRIYPDGMSPAAP